MRSCNVSSVSSSSTGTASWARIGPESTSSVTRCTVQPGDLHAGGERVAHRVPALERGQQRRMRVHGPAAERVDERLRQDRAEARRSRRDRRRGARARRRPPSCRRPGRRSGRSRCARRARPPRRRRGRRRAPRTGRSVSTTTTGSRRSSIAWRMVPLPEARTPTRILAHPSHTVPGANPMRFRSRTSAGRRYQRVSLVRWTGRTRRRRAS